MNNPNDGSYFGFGNQQYLGQAQQQGLLQQGLLQQNTQQRAGAQGLLQMQPGLLQMNPGLVGGMGGAASALQ
jgi:hypothetical protein